MNPAHSESAESVGIMCCERCSVKVSRLCCDVCDDSESLCSVIQPVQKEVMKRAKRKYKVPNYIMGDPEHHLRRRLEEWRELQLVEEDLATDDFFGPQVIMSNSILTRIVGLAHTNKITSVESLLSQTDWVYSKSYGPKILEIIQATIPLPSTAQWHGTLVLQDQHYPQNSNYKPHAVILPDQCMPGSAGIAITISSYTTKCAAYKCCACGAIGLLVSAYTILVTPFQCFL